MTCLYLPAPTTPRELHLCLLAITLMKLGNKRDWEEWEGFFFPLQPRECIFPYQERDLGRRYISTINSRQAIAHALNSECCLHDSLFHRLLLDYLSWALQQLCRSGRASVNICLAREAQGAVKKLCPGLSPKTPGPVLFFTHWVASQHRITQ